MIQRLEAGPRMSEATVHGGLVYLAGQVPEDATADIAGQTRQVLEAIDALLAQAGSDRRHLLMATLYLADMADYDAMNAVWDDWLPAGCAPARACVQARLAKPEYRVEIALTAAVVQS